MPLTVSGGILHSDELVFVPERKGQPWQQFLNLLEDHREEHISIILEVITESENVFRSSPCQVSVKRLLEPIDRTKSDHLRYYYATNQCEVVAEINE